MHEKLKHHLQNFILDHHPESPHRRILRALSEQDEPMDVKNLANATKISPGRVLKVAEYLQKIGVVDRDYLPPGIAKIVYKRI